MLTHSTQRMTMKTSPIYRRPSAPWLMLPRQSMNSRGGKIWVSIFMEFECYLSWNIILYEVMRYSIWNQYSPCFRFKEYLLHRECGFQVTYMEQFFLLRGYCTPSQFCNCLCIFVQNYNTFLTSKICFS